MLSATNSPYRKQYDEHGLPINPGTIRNDGSNRKNRRAGMQKQRAFNNSKNVQQIVTPRHRWLKKKQLVTHGVYNIRPVLLPNGKQKVINHLIFVQ